MADIAASDVTYALVKQRKLADSRNSNLIRLSFGDGVLTYPANGIPLVIGKMGCPVIVESMQIVDQGASGYKFQYDQSAKKLIIMQAPAQTHAHNLLVKGGQAAAGTAATAHYATDIFGKEAVTDATILGSASATKGGVISSTLAAAGLAEASGVAIAAQVIEVEVIGY